MEKTHGHVGRPDEICSGEGCENCGKTRSEILDRIERLRVPWGWMVQLVYPPEGAAYPYLFGYTIGLADRFGHPELMILGTSQANAIAVLNLTAERVHRGARFVDGQRDDCVIGGAATEFDVCFRLLHRSRFPDWVGLGMDYHEKRSGKHDFEVLVIYWPDAGNLLPWEPGHNPTMLPKQPLLFIEVA